MLVQSHVPRIVGSVRASGDPDGVDRGEQRRSDRKSGVAEASAASGRDVAQASKDDDPAAIDLERVCGVQRPMDSSGVRISVWLTGRDGQCAIAVRGVLVLLRDLCISVCMLWVACRIAPKVHAKSFLVPPETATPQ